MLVVPWKYSWNLSFFFKVVTYLVYKIIKIIKKHFSNVKLSYYSI